MIQCPQCLTDNKVIHAKCWLVFGTIPITISKSGIVKSAGPMTPSVIIKEGMELHKSPDIRYVCPKCSYVGPLNSFTIVESCRLTGGSADVFITIPHFTEEGAWVSNEVAGMVEEILQRGFPSNGL